jgi:hypothetical protein
MLDNVLRILNHGRHAGFDVVTDHHGDLVAGVARDELACQLDSTPAPDGVAGLRANRGWDLGVNGEQNTAP